MSPITIFKAFNPAEAQLVRSRLEAAGFHPFVADELSALSIDGYSLAAGGIRDPVGVWAPMLPFVLASPVLAAVLFIAVVLRFIDAFRKFEGIQILTTGGPGIASTPLNLQIYNTGLFYHQVGYAAAMGVLLIALIAASVGVLYVVAGRRS